MNASLLHSDNLPGLTERPLLVRNPDAGFRRRVRRHANSATEEFTIGSGPLPDPRDYSLLILEGGDGTAQHCLTEWLNAWPTETLPPVALLPGGHTNMSAAGINRKPRRGPCARSLAAILAGASPAAVQQRALVRVQAGQVMRYGCFFGIGRISAAVARWAEDRPTTRLGTRARTAWSAWRGYFGKGLLQTVCIGNQERRVFAMLATSLDRLLLGCRPFWNADADVAADSAPSLHSTWLFAESRGRLRRSARLLRGDASLERLPGYHSCDVRQLEFELDGAYVLDGEIFQHQGRLQLAPSQPLRWLIL